MWLFILILDLILYYQTNQSLSHLSKTILNKFRRLEIGINSIKYPKSSLRSMNKLNEEDYTIENFRQGTEQNFFSIMNEGNKMQQIREKHKKLENNRDILTKILKNQNSHLINLTEIEKNTLIYVHALKQINTRYGLNFRITGSLSDELNEQSIFFHFWSNSYPKSQIKIDKVSKKEFGIFYHLHQSLDILYYH